MMIAAGIRPTDRPDWAYEVCGNTVIRTAIPRFSASHVKQADGSWTANGDNIRWLDEPPMDAALLAQWMRECGEVFAVILRDRANGGQDRQP